MSIPPFSGAPVNANFAKPSNRIQAFGDSRAAFCGLDVNVAGGGFAFPSIRFPGNSPLAWANRFLRGRLNFNLALGYQGSFQGIAQIKVVNGGSKYTAPTITITAPAGTGLVLGSPVLDANGAILSVSIITPGTGYSAIPSFTVTDATGSGAVLLAIIGGTGTFGNGGETSTNTLQRLSDIIASPVDIVFVTTGTNDLTNGISASTTKANLKTIFDTLIQAGKIVVFCPDQARSVWGSLSGTGITNARHQLYNVKRWAYNYAAIQTAQNTNGNKNIIIVDCEDFWPDPTSSVGNPYSNMTADGLHWSQASAQITGLRIANQLSGILSNDLSSPYNIVSQADNYDATYNPDGACNFNWLFAATAGAVTAPVTGIVATNFNAFRNAGTATSSIVASIENPRSDELGGNRQVLTVSIGGATTNEEFGIGIFTTPISTFNINTGDTIIAECETWLQGHVNVNQLYLQIAFYASGSGIATAQDGDSTLSPISNYGSYMALNGDYTPMTFKTPPIVVPSNATNVSLYMIVGLDGSGAANSATAVMKVANMKIRKVV